MVRNIVLFLFLFLLMESTQRGFFYLKVAITLQICERESLYQLFHERVLDM